MGNCSLTAVLFRRQILTVLRNNSRKSEKERKISRCLTEKPSSKMLTCPKRCNRTLWIVPPRHCIVGRNFGSYVTHETRHFIYFYLGQVAILLFKSGYFTFLVLCCICLAFLLNGFQTLSFLYLTYSPSFHIVKVEKICFYWVVLSGNFLKGLFLSATSLSR